MLPAQIKDEVKNINKKRTFGLLGFLFILAFFPMLFSDHNEKQHNPTEIGVLAAQDTKANQAISPSQAQGAPGAQQAPVSAAPTQAIQIPVQEEAYSPQPSIWLFIIPIVITFFTILFY